MNYGPAGRDRIDDCWSAIPQDSEGVGPWSASKRFPGQVKRNRFTSTILASCSRRQGSAMNGSAKTAEPPLTPLPARNPYSCLLTPPTPS